MVSSTILTLLVIPAISSLWKEWEVRRNDGRVDRPALPATRPLAEELVESGD